MFGNIWNKVKIIMTDAWVFIEPFVKLFVSQSGKIVLQSAVSAVQIVADTMNDADGNKKREKAFELIVEDLKRAEVEIGTSIINSAIEVAVQKIKND